MKSNQTKLSASLRIIWAIAFKDMVDAIKNKTILSVVLGVGLLMLSGMALPLLMGLADIHRMVIYPEADSQSLAQLGGDIDFDIIPVESPEQMEAYMTQVGGKVMGLAVPADFDQLIASDGEVILEGYFVHWVNETDAAEEREYFEAQLSDIFGKPVRINAEGNQVYPPPDSDGQPFMTAISITIAILTISIFIVPYLMIEEKETKTMDALLVSPARISEVVVGKALAGLIYGLTAAAIVMAFNQAMIVHWWLAILAAICGTLLTVAVGLLLGSIFENPASMNLWLGMVMAALMLPVFLVNSMKAEWPEIVKFILTWIPSVPLSKLFRISLSGSVLPDQVLLYFGVVLGSAALILAVVAGIVRRMDR